MSVRSVNDCTSTTSDAESQEDEIEPKLKYVRLANDLKTILLTQSATCIAVHSKFLALGSQTGEVHLLDHQGNRIGTRKSHTVDVNHISIDASGEHIATCSDDGRIFIHSLFASEHNVSLNLGRLVKTIALDPLYYKGGANRRFITGDDKLTLYEKTFLGSLRPTVLCESEGFVKALSWGVNFIAWSSNIGVRVYDLLARCSLGLIKWEQPAGSQTIDKFRCNLRWSDAKTLLIGWMDTVRVCAIRKRTSFELANRDLPEHLVEPIATFRTEFLIGGIAPLDGQLVVLGAGREADGGRAPRPKLYIIEYGDNDYSDVCTDSLSLRGYEEYRVNDYHLEVLTDENRFFVVAPRDVVIASAYDLDDRIQWFIQHKKFEEALDILIQNDNRQIQRHTVQSVGIDYLDYLLSRGMYDAAGKLCLKIFGKNEAIWEDQIYKFATVHQLRSVSPYIPCTSDCILNPHIYEMILYEYLKLDARGFLHLIKEWNPTLYNIEAVVSAVLDHLLITEIDNDLYLESLAILYSFQKSYDKSISVYLKLQHKDVFQLIEKYQLFDVINDMLIDLMNLDYNQTIALLLNSNKISIRSEMVVKKLSGNQRFLYLYLDEYNKKHRRGEYHRELVKLYAVFARDKLLPFLKQSDHYPIEEALDICQRAKFHAETAYLLGRMGDTKTALDIIVNQLKDMQHAINFCREHEDPDLWHDLINHSLKQPTYVKFLLESIGTYVDPTLLVQTIANGMKIPNLKESLVMMLHQYSLQVSVQDDCRKILASDYFNLIAKLVRVQQKGVVVDEEVVCGACHHPLIDAEVGRVRNGVVFNCRHAFHEVCGSLKKCGICYPVEK